MRDPLRARAEAAVAGYRNTGDRAHLDQLQQDGHRQLAHDLTMEDVLRRDPDQAKPYTDLAGGPILTTCSRVVISTRPDALR